MEISEAQREVHQVYVGGFPGLLVSSVVWLLSSILMQLLFAVMLLSAVREDNRRCRRAT